MMPFNYYYQPHEPGGINISKCYFEKSLSSDLIPLSTIGGKQTPVLKEKNVF